MKPYKIYALKYAGPVKKCGAHFLWQKDWDKTRSGNFYFWCIRNKEQTILVDTGVSPDMAIQRNLPNYINPATLLFRLGVKAEEIQHVIITHLHWDHAGGVTLFPNATYYLHQKEFSFWTKDKVSSTPPFKLLSDQNYINHLKAGKNVGRLVLIKEERQVFPGIKLIPAPGHSPGLMAVAVNTETGTAVVGSDAAYAFDNYSENWPSDVIFNMEDAIKTMEKLRKKASSPALLFPGHDTGMADHYPRAAKDITRLA